MVIDDESSVREALQRALEADGYKVATFPSGQAFFADAERGRFRCLVVDLNMPGMNGLALQDRLKRERSGTPIIFLTGSGALSSAVQAMREGAADFLQKPVRAEALRESVRRVLANSEQAADDRAQRDEVAARLATLSERERQVMDRVVVGQATKNIAADLRIQRAHGGAPPTQRDAKDRCHVLGDVGAVRRAAHYGALSRFCAQAGLRQYRPPRDAWLARSFRNLGYHYLGGIRRFPSRRRPPKDFLRSWLLIARERGSLTSGDFNMKAPQWREEAGGTSFGIFALISRPSMSFLFSPASSSASAIASAAKSTAHRP